ncbi:MAG: peroxiredoxin [Dehalococcoidia bacterium]
MTLKVGDKAQPIGGVNQDGEEVELDMSGKVVLYFYPEDDTTGCTTEACQFRDDLPDYQEMGATVVGVSTDDAESHRRFAQQQRLNFTLIADPDKAIVSAYDVLDRGDRAQRVTYVIENGLISHVFPKVNPNGHSREVWMTLFGRANGPPKRGDLAKNEAVSEGEEIHYDVEKASEDIAHGLGQRFRDIAIAIDRVDRLRGPGPATEEGWLGPFLTDKAQVTAAAEDLLLRAFRTASDPINFKLLRHLAKERTVSVIDLIARAGLTRLGGIERINDLIQVGLCSRELEGDLIQANSLTDAMVGLLGRIRDRLATKVSKTYAKSRERSAHTPAQHRTGK